MPITVDSTGVHSPSLLEAQEEMLVLFGAVFGVDLSLADQTPQAQLAALMAVIQTEVGDRITELAAGVDLGRATGAQLDVLGSLADTARRPPTRSQVTATLTGTPGTTVSAGSLAATTSGDLFQTVAAATLQSGGTETEMVSAEYGPVAAGAGTLTAIVSQTAGWETITNTDPAVPGQLSETDTEYRRAIGRRAQRNALGPVGGLVAAVDEAGATGVRVTENTADTATVTQEVPIPAHGLAIIARGGTNTDLRRAVEQHRSQGVPTVTAIHGGTPNNTALDAVSNGTVRFGGVDYTGLNLTAANTSAAKAAALTTLLADAGVTVRWFDNAYHAFFTWKPGTTASRQFTSGTVVDAFGFDPDETTSTDEPFMRPRDRALTITVNVTRRDGFPADGLEQIKTAITAVVDGYGIGEQVWLGDLEAAAERIPGTRVTSITATHSSAAVSGTDPPLDARWTLPAANLTVNVT